MIPGPGQYRLPSDFGYAEDMDLAKVIKAKNKNRKKRRSLSVTDGFDQER